MPTFALTLGAQPIPPRPTFGHALTDWTFAALQVVIVVAAAGMYLRGVHVVAEKTPSHLWSNGRTACFLGGLGLLLFAAVSPIATWEDDLFSVHMVQHLIILSLAAPLLMAGGPVTLAIRASSPRFRRGVLLPLLRSWPVKAITFPPVAWLQFALVLWGTHFTWIFDASLTNDWLHELEHLMYLTSACLFWWPALGVDPSRWKLSNVGRVFYVFLGMPQMTLLGLVLISASHPLYPHYITVAQIWGVDALEDQKLAAWIMWAPSEIVYVVVLLILVAKWLNAEERSAARIDAQLDGR